MNCIVGDPVSLWSSNLYDDKTMAQLWDFYVTKGPSSLQARRLNDYSKNISYDALIRIAGAKSKNCRLLKANSMSKTLVDLGFYQLVKKSGKSVANPRASISTDEPRWCCLQLFEIRDDEPPRAKNGDGDVLCLLRHVRNAFAHGTTYVLDGKNVLLCDKDSKPSAWILVRSATLVDWVKYIDFNGVYYFKNDNRDEIKRMLV